MIDRSINPVSTTPYIAVLFPFNAPALQGNMTNQSGNPWQDAPRAFIHEGRNIAVSAETTGGTVSLLACRVKYARIP